MSEFDVVVVGAGTAGSSLAEYVAHRGFRVALVDRRAQGEIGDKVCGDAISHRHFEVTGFKPPEPGDTVNRVRGIR
ncbi:MAG: FAD-dependent oxidoreductase [Candidatus Geothermarchaeales archaeon]